MLYEVVVTSTVLIIGVFCLRRLTMGKINMRLRYGLWLLVAARLLLPVSVGTSALSVMNLMPETFREKAQAFSTGGAGTHEISVDDGRDLTPADGKDDVFSDRQYTGAGMETAGGQAKEGVGFTLPAGEAEQAETKLEGKPTGKNGAVSEAGGTPLSKLLAALWFLGFFAVGSYMLFESQRFVRYLHRNRGELPAERLPDEFAQRLAKRNMRVYQVTGLPGPCLVGRHIYIGEGAAAKEQNLIHVLAHEYCHALHGDRFWAFLRCALAAVYWFDPFVWAAAYAAKQDSELACDETAVGLLGESSRFAYGRTLLALLESGGSGKCPGMSFMTEGGERSVRERITALAKKSRTKRTVLIAVLAAATLVCGCAFTGAEQEGVDFVEETGQRETAGAVGDGQNENDVPIAIEGQEMPTVIEEGGAEFDRIQKEYEDVVAQEKLAEEQVKEVEKKALEEADKAAFEETLHYHGDMDDQELLQKQEFDVQSYYDWKSGKNSEKPEDGWYLLCREDGGLIYLYGLYTEEFGFRGLKLRIGQDETTLDIPWCASLSNKKSENIRILEYAENRAPRRFVWKLPVEESGTSEIWRLYSGFRYDTGTIDLRTLTEEDCLAWAKKYLTFDVDKEAAEALVTYDGDMYLGAIDISAYQDFETQDVQIVPDAVSFTLDDSEKKRLHYDGDEGDYQTYSDTLYEGTAVYLTAGLKLKGVDGLWFDGLSLLTIQVVADEDSATGFRLESPRIDETYVACAPWQEKALSNPGSRAGNATDGDTGQDELEEPLVNETQEHYDLEIAFINPCPDCERISDQYGERVNPATQEVRVHTGVDMAAKEGKDILAAADGTVFMRGFDAVNGNYVVLWHGQSGQMTYYAHCKTVEVKKGQQVAQGEKIATVGQTGMATGPFLHFAISSGTNWEDPYFLELE